MRSRRACTTTRSPGRRQTTTGSPGCGTSDGSRFVTGARRVTVVVSAPCRTRTAQCATPPDSVRSVTDAVTTPASRVAARRSRWYCA
ncbi:Uncharacterised protein [Mycobacteroides abscessus]|nr:Uncharacterised protein [Mycobacteroides abscessus]